ncbi:MAG: 2-phosphosulfolactate phosphatase [Vicinamibacteria bacterium]
MFEETATARRRIVIDSFPESVVRYSGSHAVVCIDVLTASTTLVTSLSETRPTFIAPSRAAAIQIAAGLTGHAGQAGQASQARPILAGEAAGRPSEILQGFELLDSPSALAKVGANERPLVLHSSAACDLISGAALEASETYVCGLRNLDATARALASRSRNVAIIGAGYHSEFSCEDQFACAHLAQRLLDLGYALGDPRSMEIVRRWSDADLSFLAWGNSAAALRKAGRAEDVDFVLAHYDDLSFAARARPRGEIAIEIPFEASVGSAQPPAALPDSSPSLKGAR